MIGVSMLLLAVGAILTFAVTATVSGVDLDLIGVILMIIGAGTLLWALLASGSDTGRGRVYDRK